MTLNELMAVAVYQDGGRGPLLFDCWGWLRYVRHELQGRALLRSWGQVRVDDLRGATRAWREQLVELEPCQAEEGAIAAVFRDRLLVHVGTVIELGGLLQVSDITPVGARLLDLHDFERQYLRVEYHRDRIQESAGVALGAPRGLRQPAQRDPR